MFTFGHKRYLAYKLYFCIFAFWSKFGHFSMSSFGRLRLLAYRIRISDCVFVFSIFCCCCILIKVVAKDVLQCLHSVVKGRWQLVGTQIFWGPPYSFFSVFVIATVIIIIMIIINSDNPCGMTCLSFSKTGGVTNHNGKPCESPHCTPPPSQGEGRRGYSNSYQDSTDRKIMKISKVFKVLITILVHKAG